MLTILTIDRATRLFLMFLVFVAFVGVADADDLYYLPDDCVMLFRADLAKLRGSALGKETKLKVPGLEQKVTRDLSDHGFRSDDVLCATSGSAIAGEPVTIYTLANPVNAKTMMQQLKNLDRPNPQLPVTFHELKVGPVTIYQLIVGGENRFEGYAFCIPEKNVVLISHNIPTLKGVLERMKAPRTSAEMEKVINHLPKDEGVTVLFDVASMGKHRDGMKEQMNRDMPGVGDLIFTGNLVYLSIAAGEKLTLKAVSVCADKTQADVLKKRTEKTISDVKTLLRSDPVPEEVSKSLVVLLDSVKLSTSGTRSEAVAVADSALAMPVLSFLYPTRPASKKK